MTTVRPLEQTDQPQWVSLYREYADFYQVPVTQEILDNVWSWIFDDSNAFFCLVAEQGGALVGLMHCRAMPSPLRGKLVGFLDDLYVNPKSRGNGTVDQLFVGLKNLAKDQQWPFVRWITAEDNYRGRAVYDRLSNKTPWQTYQLDIDS